MTAPAAPTEEGRRVIEVIVSLWSAEGQQSYGLVLRHEEYSCDEEAVKRAAKPFCQKGFSVIVRPRYNDGDHAFHEWRSFDGEAFRRSEFAC